MRNTSKTFQQIGTFGIITLLILSLLFLDASKYDTADRVWLVLLVGLAAILIPVFFGFDGIKKNPRISLLLAAFCVAVWLSFVFSQTKNFGFSEAVMYTVAAAFGLAVSASSEKNQRFLLKSIIIIALIASAYGFWYFPTHGESRMAGLFFDAADPRHFFPNAFANFLLLAWPLPIVLRDTGHGIRGKKSALIILSILIAALYLTYSRAAWLTLIIQCAALGAYCIYKKYNISKILKHLAIVIIGVLIISIVLLQLRALNFGTPDIAEKITFGNTERATSYGERADFWKGAFSLALQKPFFGYGPMSFRYAYPPLQQKFLGISDHPHNWLLKIAAENGIPAAVLFGVLLIAGLYRAFWKNRTHHIPFLGIALLGGILHNMADYNMNFTALIASFFIILGIIFSFDKSPTQETTLSRISITLWCTLLFFTSVISARELFITFQNHKNPENPFAYASSNFPRDFLRFEAEKKLTEGEMRSANELLDLHLAKNPLDAYAWLLRGDSKRALELDPMNNFGYYRASLEQNTLTALQKSRLEQLLMEYDDILKNNVHYTAFTQNAHEAARIYELLGDTQKALEIRKMAAGVRTTAAEKENFNKRFGPRTLREFLRQ